MGHVASGVVHISVKTGLLDSLHRCNLEAVHDSAAVDWVFQDA